MTKETIGGRHGSNVSQRSLFDSLLKLTRHCRSEEHVDMVKQLVQARIDNESTEKELIRYKTM
jgi:hypothetical protein